MALDITGRRTRDLPLIRTSVPSRALPAPDAAREAGEAAVPDGDWRRGLPVLHGEGLTLRELQLSDAPHLLPLLNETEVSRFLAPPPRTGAGLRRFVRWAHRQRAEGRYACFAIVPRGTNSSAGFFQLRALDTEVATAEWGFVLGRPYWGTGLFAEGAALAQAFAFGCMGVRRLEARALAANGRAQGALLKVGAVREGVLRQAFAINGQRCDTTLWSILDTDWRARLRARGEGRVRVDGPLSAATYLQ